MSEKEGQEENPEENQEDNGDSSSIADDALPAKAEAPERPKEIGGPKGPEPTRYGDWEKNGRCTDF